MSRRTTAGALALALLILVAPPAAAKGPNQVEVHDLRTGATTLLTSVQDELFALMELVGWPASPREPRGVRSGALEHVATLRWQYDEETPAWVDRVYYSDRSGATWVERRDHLVEPVAVSWGRVEAGYAFDTVLSAIEKPAIEKPAEVTTAAPLRAPAVEPTRDPGREAAARLDAVSFGWGAGLACLLAAGLVLAARWRRSLSSGVARS